MYSVKPIGLNLKDNDRDVPDGSLLESINMQWRDGAFKPIPERIISEINASGYTNIILHKVGDENTINVLGFNSTPGSATFLAYDLAEYLGGRVIGGNILEWFGTITNGVYATKTITQVNFVKTPGMSFTILNGLTYFMGDGSSEEEQYFVKLEFDDATQSYNLYDMYAWKDLIPSYNFQGPITCTLLKKTYNALAAIGVIGVRFALVLKSGEVVLPTPVYAFNIYALNTSDSTIALNSAYTNIHTVINLDLDFSDTDLFKNEISAINVYASIPNYHPEIDFDANHTFVTTKRNYQLEGIISDQAESPFYLIKTLDNTTTKKIVLYADGFDWNIDFAFGTDFFRIDMSTIAAGEIMPVDNFTYHRIFGKIGSYNGRLDVIRPTTVLSGGHVRALAISDGDSTQGYSILTEDGSFSKKLSVINKYVGLGVSLGTFKTRGILSYPDYRATAVGLHELAFNKIYFFKCRKNASHNLSCNFNFTVSDNYDQANIDTDPGNPLRSLCTINYDAFFEYVDSDNDTTTDLIASTAKYTSENRVQFSQIGEFKVWPAINSYRIGEGRVVNMGTGSVNPTESQVISPIIIGTSDGVYTVNLDPMGNNFIASITKTKNIPFISEEILEIDNNILFISDQGLMVFSNGDIQNLTIDFFPPQGNGDYPPRDNIFQDYDTLTTDFFGSGGNPYELDDIVTYLRGAIMAYDGRRRNIWVSNPAYNFSLVYNLDMRQWGMSTLVFSEKQEVFSIVNTAQGDIYTRYMVKKAGSNNLLILSGEDLTTEVFYHVLTRPIKFQNTDDYKVLPRMISRTLLIRDTEDGYFSIGLWGQQEVNKYKKSIALALKKDSRTAVYPENMRYHLPVDCRKGKYKAITVLQAGKALPESYISSFDFDIYLVDNTKMR